MNDKQKPATLDECFEAAEMLQKLAVRDKPRGDTQAALDAIENGLMSLSIEERECYQSGFSSKGLRLANIGNQIGASLNTIRAALTAQPDVNAELLEALNKINTMACYASEEDVDSREAVLLMIGNLARQAIANAEQKGGV